MRFRLSIGSDCNLRCRYCFIDKEKGEHLSQPNARMIIEGVLALPGRRHRIDIYGGEPLAYFDRLKQVVEEIRAQSRAARKTVRCAVATNGTLLRAAHLDFFRKNEVEVCISLEGPGQGGQRIYADGRESRDEAWRGARLALKKMPPSLLTGLLCVHPSQAAGMDEDFDSLVRCGFRGVNLEVILGVPWTEARKRDFSLRFGAIARRIHADIESGERVFLQSVCRHFLPVPPSQGAEIYPDGKPGPVPYPFAHLPADRKVSSLEGTDVLALRDRLSLRLARDILRKAARNAAYSRYVRAARKRYEG